MDYYTVNVNGVYITRVDIGKKQIEFMLLPESCAAKLDYNKMEYVKNYYPMALVKMVTGIKEVN